MIIKKTLGVALVCFVLASMFFSAAAETGIETRPLEKDEQERIWNNISVRRVSAPAANISIDCFDVREDGWIALGLDGAELENINVYDETGVFQYGHTFDISGSYSLEWKGRNLVLYIFRSDLAVEFDEKARLVEMREIVLSSQTFRFERYLETKIRVVNGVRYELRSWLPLTPNYPQAVIIDQDGREKIIYDNSLGYNVVFLLIVICFAAWLVFFPRMLIRTYREYKRQHGG